MNHAPYDTAGVGLSYVYTRFLMKNMLVFEGFWQSEDTTVILTCELLIDRYYSFREKMYYRLDKQLQATSFQL